MSIHILEVEFGTPAFDELLSLRNKILRVPLGMVFYVEDISLEYDQIHLAAYNDCNLLLGCLTLQLKSDSEVKMRQVVVDTEVQNNGIGRKLIEASEVWSRDRNFQYMILHARDVAVPFYLKLNYKKVGKEFEEVGIKHWKMRKKL